MENEEKNEGISVNQPEPVERAIEDDFEILDIRDAQEDDTTEWTEIQNAIVATGKEENIMEIDRLEEVGNTDRREVAGEKEKKEGVNHVDFFESGRRPKPCKLEFLGDRSVKIDNEEVALSKLRYATRRQYKGFPQRAAHCIIVSYVAPTDTGEAVVKHRFLEMPDVNGTMNLEQDFKPVIGNIMEQLDELDPKEKGLLHGPRLAVLDRGWRRRPAREWERPADRGTEVWEYHQRQIQITIVRELTTELNKAAASFATNEDMQMYWITVEEDLRLIIESRCVQETDPYSGGLDPDNGDHLKRALNDVADQLSEQQLELAVSRIQAARRMFSGSRNPEIWHIFQADDMELLRKLYFRSLVK